MNLRMGFRHFDCIFKVYWAVTIYLKLFLVGLADFAPFTHVDILGEELVLFRVDDGEGMDGN